MVFLRRLEGGALRSTALPRFMLLHASMYAAFEVASPFLPAFVSARGVSAEQLGLVLGAGTVVRLLTAPLAGRTGDVLQGLRVVLVVCAALAASVTLGYLRRTDFGRSWRSACCTPRRWGRSPFWRMPWRWSPPLRRQAVAAVGLSTAGCAARAPRPSSSARCCPGRR